VTRQAGKKAVSNGQWLTKPLPGWHSTSVAKATLIAHHQGQDRPELADALIRNAGITSGRGHRRRPHRRRG
jgi:hypothetical protein